MHASVFIIDDEVELAQYTAKYFNASGVKTEYACDAQSALAWLEENTVSLILLDINLGKTSGFDLCQKLRRETDVPILFISARSSDDDMMLALNIGGDDYVCKPYSLGVLLAKVKAVLKRYENSKAAGKNSGAVGKAPGEGQGGSGMVPEAMEAGGTGPENPESGYQRGQENSENGYRKGQETLEGGYRRRQEDQKAGGETEESGDGRIWFDKISVDLKSGIVSRDGHSERLKAMEYKVLTYMLNNKNRIIPKDEFFEKVWETEFVGDVTLNVHVRHLREKLEENPKEPKFIKTVWGVGFILEI